MKRQLVLMRYSSGTESTLGLLFHDNNFLCYTLEDEKREIKIAGETRIPEGEYEVSVREVLSEKTKQYREKHAYQKIGFDWHLWLKDVPNFDNVYIHVGNTDGDTEGCILVGDTANYNKFEDGFIGNSIRSYSRIYPMIRGWQKDGDKVYINIIDLTI